ncbi:MAG TPA: BTAD domain-containing putative transcriptional regulator [Candidatus Dormibacteraeota bacterium]|nr:BTAD domain-containing putative transcriptional regulator [Candidatus Dormibacteraeota bacterium]
MQYRLLGPLEAVDGDRPLNLGGRKQRALLALLLLDANRVVAVERIIDELWGECPPDTAANAVQVHVAGLRRVLEPQRAGGGSAAVLVTRSPGYLISVDADAVDVLRFERLVDEARQMLARDPEGASARLKQALALRRGPTLADVVLLGPARGQITRLEELHLAALEDRIQADLRLGRHAALVGELGAMVAAHPLGERLRAQLMLALYRCGRQAEALDAYQAARRLLSEELGIDPGTELQQLERAILRQDPSLDWRRGADSAPARPTTSGRPAAPTHRAGAEEWMEVSGPSGDRLCPLEGGRVAVGRHDGNDIVLEGDDRASRLHAVLDRVGGGWCLTDLGSSNGTYVNGLRITSGRALRHGDEVQIGSTRLVYRVRRADRAERVTSVEDRPAIPPS